MTLPRRLDIVHSQGADTIIMDHRICLLFFFLTSLLAADPADSVREASAGWLRAALKQDKAALERLLANDLSYTHSSGRLTQTKAEYIATVTGKSPTYDSLENSDLQVRVYDNVAVVTGHISVKLVGREPFRVRALQFFVHRDAGWQLAAFQSERLP